MSRKKSSFNIGCLIVIILIVIIYLTFVIWALPAESIAELGLIIECISGLAISYFVCKFLFRDKPEVHDDLGYNFKKSVWGRLLIGIACIIITGGIILLITSINHYAAGIGWIIVASIIAGYLLYKNSKE